MKKALALVLALVLALSMAVSAFALDLVVLDKDPVAVDGPDYVVISDAKEEYTVFYTTKAGVYYIALDLNIPYTDVKATGTGCVTAEKVEFDPDKMVLIDADKNLVPVIFNVTYKGEALAGDYSYTEALAEAEKLNKDEKVTYYGIKMASTVNVIKVTVEQNYTEAYKEGNVNITAKIGTDNYSGSLKFINDVSIFEYEMVKWTAANYANKAVLELGEVEGYSDYDTYLKGYGKDYVVGDLRTIPDAAVISTTAFRAIEGKNIALTSATELGALRVDLKNIAAGQKGVNFKHTAYTVDANRDGKIESLNVDFFDNEVVSSDYTVTLATGYNWYTLREAFGKKVEEKDIITYTLLKDGKPVAEYEVDYMKVSYSDAVVLSYNGSNSALGSYALVIDVPAGEVGEENPNTGAESVVGVVAALAVVSLATAAAVSLKK